MKFFQTLRASANLEFTLFYALHKNNKKNSNKDNKNPHQNIPEGSTLKAWNLAHGLKLMEEDLPRTGNFDGRQTLMERQP